VPGNVSSTGIDQASAATAGAETMEPVDGGGATVVACGGEKGREAHNTPGFLEEQREREARGSPEPANRQRIPMVALFIMAGKGFNPRSSQRRGGEDVHQRPKGVGALLFGCSEMAGRWRGGLPSGARLGSNGRRALGQLELKPRERRMGVGV
jgi:hypothetical protein